MCARPTAGKEAIMSQAVRQDVTHPRAVPVSAVPQMAAEAETPFAEGSRDELDPDLRHRLISERAYSRYCERGYADGYDLDDWLEAEAEIDHLTLPPGGAA
jgi:hypothetical protein